jgi:hypothetical protein
MTLKTIRDRLLTRLECDPTDLQWQAAGTAAINEGQRLFVLLSLCLEATRELVLTPGVNMHHMLTEQWTDWLVPLRVRLSNDTATGQDAKFDSMESDTGMFGEQAYPGLTTNAKPKLRPATLYQLAANDPAWINATGTPTRYGCIAWDLLFIDKKPTQSGQKLLITYARSPVPLVNDNDVPEMRDVDHECLMDYGEWRLRCNEGGQELTAAQAKLKSFLDNAKMRAQQVTARSLSLGYDRLPPELRPESRQNPLKRTVKS